MHLIDFPNGAYLRQSIESDRADLYRVCVQTGIIGSDASHLFRMPRMLGEIYVGPYLTFEPNYSFTIVDGEITGYLLATLDTAAFEEREEVQWWPALRSKYLNVGIENFTDEEKSLFAHMQNPPRTPKAITDEFPSQLHIDLVTKSQRKGFGKPLIMYLLKQLTEANSPGVHLHVNPINDNAIGFYEKLGFVIAHKSTDEWLMTRKL
ncbi:unannotated protein [freshwater metagenome]|uniref:Unannotated protein n=1 Tax=freshwater metagenome TaxID=449393 RepID=A0A6J7B9C5_9ZZZZ|nr:GNAT family N-acetyltransferase [Actinomycetota bacterium]